MFGLLPKIFRKFPTMKTLTFAALRAANEARLPLFKNSKGGPAHSEPDGSDWPVDSWTNALCGEAGEAANFAKKLLRGDIDLDEARTKIGKELADVVIYADLTAKRLGLDLGDCVVGKFNEVSERVGADVVLDYDRDTTLASLQADVLEIAAGVAQLQMTLDEMIQGDVLPASDAVVYGKVKIDGAQLSMGKVEDAPRATGFPRIFEAPYGEEKPKPVPTQPFEQRLSSTIWAETPEQKRYIPIGVASVQLHGGGRFAGSSGSCESGCSVQPRSPETSEAAILNAWLRPALKYIEANLEQFPGVKVGDARVPVIVSKFVEWASVRKTGHGKTAFSVLDGYALNYESMAKSAAMNGDNNNSPYTSFARDLRQNIIPQVMGCDPWTDGPEMASLQTWLHEHAEAYRAPNQRVGLAGWALLALREFEKAARGSK